MKSATVRVPATAANLGPGFDCLALALEASLEVTLSIEGRGLVVELLGEGSGSLPRGEDNLIVGGARLLFREAGFEAPGLRLVCSSAIPVASGLGSSAAAVLAGLTAANAILGGRFSPAQILNHAAGVEGHGDNAAAALHGGLTVATSDERGWSYRRLPIAEMQVAVATPAVHLPTEEMRRLLPAEVRLVDASFNLGRLALTLEGFRLGDYDLLAEGLRDRLHEAHRARHIPGAERARQAAIDAGAAAVVLGGAGPSLLAFAPGRHAEIAEAMAAAFRQASLSSRAEVYAIARWGATVIS